MARAAPWTVSHPQAPCPPQRCPAPGKAMWGGHGALGWGRRPRFGRSFTPQTLFGVQRQVASALRTGLALPRACVPQANPPSAPGPQGKSLGVLLTGTYQTQGWAGSGRAASPGLSRREWSGPAFGSWLGSTEGSTHRMSLPRVRSSVPAERRQGQ